MPAKSGTAQPGLEFICPFCGEESMETLEDGSYRCIKCGVRRYGNPVTDVVVTYVRNQGG